MQDYPLSMLTVLSESLGQDTTTLENLVEQTRSVKKKLAECRDEIGKLRPGGNEDYDAQVASLSAQIAGLQNQLTRAREDTLEEHDRLCDLVEKDQLYEPYEAQLEGIDRLILTGLVNVRDLVEQRHEVVCKVADLDNALLDTLGLNGKPKAVNAWGQDWSGSVSELHKIIKRFQTKFSGRELPPEDKILEVFKDGR